MKKSIFVFVFVLILGLIGCKTEENNQTLPKAEAPTITIIKEEEEEVTVEISNPSGKRMYYTTDESDPTYESNRYLTPIKLNKSTRIRAVTAGDNELWSDITDKYIYVNLEGLEINRYPNINYYFKDDTNLDLTGLKVVKKYSNQGNQELDLNQAKITCDTSKLGKSLLKIEYKGFYTDLNVIIIPNPQTNMVAIPAGTTTVNNGGVTLKQDIYINKYEVTQQEYKALLGVNPSNIEVDNYPVGNVGFYDVLEFCNRLSIKNGLTPYYILTNIEYNTSRDYIIRDADVSFSFGNGYRLPTVDEWNYAARGGKNGLPTTYSGSNNIDEVAWYNTSEPHQVGLKLPNELGIYDMSGNVYEYTFDKMSDGTYDSNMKGGCFDSTKEACSFDKPTYSGVHIFNSGYDGFRIVRNK